MDPSVTAAIMTAFAQSTVAMNNDHLARVGRAADSALHGLKVVEAVTAKELLVSDAGSDLARLNAGVASPGTVEFYGRPGASVSPAGAKT